MATAAIHGVDFFYYLMEGKELLARYICCPPSHSIAAQISKEFQ